ncbi:hypothetical protein ABC733_17300 [Mangrovibacter sp. SLW1]
MVIGLNSLLSDWFLFASQFLLFCPQPGMAKNVIKDVSLSRCL